jgi:hypothetical protein
MKNNEMYDELMSCIAWLCNRTTKLERKIRITGDLLEGILKEFNVSNDIISKAKFLREPADTPLVSLWKHLEEEGK